MSDASTRCFARLILVRKLKKYQSYFNMESSLDTYFCSMSSSRPVLGPSFIRLIATYNERNVINAATQMFSILNIIKKTYRSAEVASFEYLPEVPLSDRRPELQVVVIDDPLLHGIALYILLYLFLRRRSWEGGGIIDGKKGIEMRRRLVRRLESFLAFVFALPPFSYPSCRA